MPTDPRDAVWPALPETIETPAVVVDRGRLLANLTQVQGLADSAGVALRPHIKTHKSPDLARLQMELGAKGITAAKPDEALVFIEAGLPSVTVAYPLVVQGKVARLLEAARARGTELNCIADSAEGVAALDAAAAAQGRRLPVFLKVDVGLGRCGVKPAGEAGPRLARQIAEAPSLRFAGLLSHAGHAYGAGNPEGIRAVARQEREDLLGLAERLRGQGLAVDCISVGSTPSVVAHDGFQGFGEIRPGNYVFMDLTQAAIGIVPFGALALSIVVTVVSRNEDYMIVDAGSKVMSSDRGPHGSDAIKGFGLALPLDATRPEGGWPLVRLSEEHGFLAHGGRPLPIGTRLRLFPNHACTVVGLADRLLLLEGERAPAVWRVEGRGKVN